jgi:2-oxoglutarate ferredoxin oxidoreductase subunit delta
MAKRGDIVIDIERCKGCGVCVPTCPQQVIALGPEVNNKGYNYLVKVNGNCTGCTNCAVVCPDAVITVYREK